jgi:hypothetical protein
MAFTRENTAVAPPITRPSDNTAMSVKPALRRSRRAEAKIPEEFEQHDWGS